MLGSAGGCQLPGEPALASRGAGGCEGRAAEEAAHPAGPARGAGGRSELTSRAVAWRRAGTGRRCCPAMASGDRRVGGRLALGLGLRLWLPLAVLLGTPARQVRRGDAASRTRSVGAGGAWGRGGWCGGGSGRLALLSPVTSWVPASKNLFVWGSSRCGKAQETQHSASRSSGSDCGQGWAWALALRRGLPQLLGSQVPREMGQLKDPRRNAPPAPTCYSVMAITGNHTCLPPPEQPG